VADHELGQHLAAEVYDRVVVTKPSDYVPAYHDFLSTTDEKAVIAAAVGPLLLEGTILDVGAGTGDIPDLMGVEPEGYTAIEQRPEFVELLRGKGYSVIEELFPCDAPGTYDNVLMSYVLYGREQCEVVIDPAWDLVSNSGQLVVVTYRDNVDDYTKLLHRIGHTRRVNTDIRFNYLHEKFASLGRTALHTARSHVYSADIGGLATGLSFMATNTPVGTPEARAEIHAKMVAEQPYLDAAYRNADGTYQFPIDHYIFTVRKGRNDSGEAE
jgi:precorrin-6B methylase 2